MAIVVEDLLRLAWQADMDSRPGMRDALLTLVVAESGAEDAVLAQRCKRLLIAHRPDHCFASATTLSQALRRPQTAAALTTLRRMYPPVRVRHLLLRSGAANGPYVGFDLPIARVLEDLVIDRRVAPAASSARLRRRDALAARPLPFSFSVSDPDGTVAVFYLSVLLALAILLESVLKPPAQDLGSKAA